MVVKRSSGMRSEMIIHVAFLLVDVLGHLLYMVLHGFVLNTLDVIHN